MKGTQSALVRLGYQIVLAVFQAVAVVLFLLYLIESRWLENLSTFYTGGETLSIFILCVLAFTLVHAGYRVLDGVLTWRTEKSEND